jgi:type IV pilus assembly protein PilO
MTLQLNKKEKKTLLFLVILIPLLFSLLYFNYLMPLRAEVKVKQQQLQSAETLYQAVLDQKSGIQGSIEENTEFLQKRLPVKPLIDQFILDLEKAEILSDSTIVQMSFNSNQGEETTSALVESLGLTYQNTKETEVDAEVIDTLPSGIVKIPVSLSIESKSYFDLEKFLETIENLERIVTVESINFSGQPEVTVVQPESQPINYQVALSLYYLPGLVDLQKELPKIESGEPANKKNPLNSFGDITNKQDAANENQTDSVENNQSEPSDEEEQSTSEKPSSDNQEVLEYTVQPNDTLYSISMKFYKSRDGEQLIKDLNVLENNALYTGQVLKIPLPN